jgi:hypothetical protein
LEQLLGPKQEAEIAVEKAEAAPGASDGPVKPKRAKKPAAKPAKAKAKTEEATEK